MMFSVCTDGHFRYCNCMDHLSKRGVDTKNILRGRGTNGPRRHEEGAHGSHGTWLCHKLWVLYVMRGVHLVTMGPG